MPWQAGGALPCSPQPPTLHPTCVPPPLPPPGNVAWEADDKALARLFEPCGVIKVRLHTDKDTGKPKGFAHVHFRWAGRGGAGRGWAPAVGMGWHVGMPEHSLPAGRSVCLPVPQPGAVCAMPPTHRPLAHVPTALPPPALPSLPHLPRDEAGLDQAMSLDGTALLGRRIRVGYAQPKKA